MEQMSGLAVRLLGGRVGSDRAFGATPTQKLQDQDVSVLPNRSRPKPSGEIWASETFFELSWWTASPGGRILLAPALGPL